MEHQIVNRSNCVSSFFQVLSLNEARLNVNQAQFKTARGFSQSDVKESRKLGFLVYRSTPVGKLIQVFIFFSLYNGVGWGGIQVMRAKEAHHTSQTLGTQLKFGAPFLKVRDHNPNPPWENSNIAQSHMKNLLLLQAGVQRLVKKNSEAHGCAGRGHRLQWWGMPVT